MDKLYYKKDINKNCLDRCPYTNHFSVVGSYFCQMCEFFKSRNTDESWVECKLHTIHMRKEKLKRILNEK